MRCSPAEVLQAATYASNYLDWWRRNPQRALEIIEAYHVWSGFDGVGPDSEALTRSIICAVTGDCYFHLGRANAAADWYRRASTHRKWGGFPDNYADLVIKHRLRDHYANALECVEFSREHWRGVPRLKRWY